MKTDMANEQHLAKLQEGVEAWNQWRQENPYMRLDLTGANLKGSNLKGSNLKGSNIYSAKLSGADLRSANLDSANLYSANLDDAKLSGADLNGANLTGASLSSANLTGASLSSAFLVRADLSSANLRSADLEGANLRSANLIDANLTGANLTGANLSGSNLTGVDLSGINFRGANLTESNLIRVQALATNFVDATLTGACIEDWNINSQTNLKNVECDYIYLKRISSEEEKEFIFSDRIPHDPDKIFASGEFTKRYQKILETVSLYFGEGIDWQVFLDSFQKLQEAEKLQIKDGDREIPIVQGIRNAGNDSFIIEIGVDPNTDKGKFERSFFEQNYNPMLKAKEEQIKFLKEELSHKRQENNELLEIIKLRAKQQINIYNNLNNQLGERSVNHDNRNTTVENGNYNENIAGDYHENNPDSEP